MDTLKEKPQSNTKKNINGLSLSIILLWKYKKLALVIALLTIGAVLMDGLTIFTLAPIIDSLLNNETTSPVTLFMFKLMKLIKLNPTTLNLIFVITIFTVIRFLFTIINEFVVLILKYTIIKDMMRSLITTILAANWQFFVNKRSGDFLNLLQKELSSLGDGLKIVAQLYSSAIQLFLLLVIPLYISWKVTLIIIATGALFSIILMLIAKPSRRLGEENLVTANNYTSALNECLNSIKLILSYAKSKHTLQSIITLFNKHYKVTIKSQILHSVVTHLNMPLVFILCYITFYFSISLNIPTSKIVMILYALYRITPHLNIIFNNKSRLDMLVPGFLYLQNMETEASQSSQVSGTLEFKSLEKEIDLVNVSFSYPKQDTLLSSINISIPKGSMVALVGPSGSGKSTLVDIITGFNTPSKGKITIDETPLSNYDINSYRRKLSYVLQDSQLFNTSVRENLLWANPNASNSEIIESLKLANADIFTNDLPKKLDTIIGERGVRLSGGQRQRLALARAIIIKPELLILDEATSALDSESETLIQKSILNISKTTTTVIIAHRLSTIKKADLIYVVEKGTIVEKGTYQELVEKNEKFNSMLKLQYDINR